MAADTDLPVLSEAARALAARCEPKLSDLEIAATAPHGLRLFLRRVVQGSRSAGGDLDLFRERAAQRAEEGLLHLLLRSHARGVYVLWRALKESMRPGEEAALIELTDFLIGTQERVVGAVSESYLDEQSALAAEQGEQRRTLVRGLLDGSLPAGRVLADHPDLDAGALVIALRMPPTAIASPSPVAVRRRLRRVQSVLARAFGVDVLTLLDDCGGHAIVPGYGGGYGDGHDGGPELADRLRHACAAEVRLAVVPAEGPEAIPDAARTAEEVLRVARACGLPPGLHRLDDVLLEYHLSRRNESSGRIAALLDPLSGRPDLVETLRTYLACRQERRTTARRLGLHPNTVDNRLTRLTELTGLDLASPRGTALALAALLLRGEAWRRLETPGDL